MAAPIGLRVEFDALALRGVGEKDARREPELAPVGDCRDLRRLGLNVRSHLSQRGQGRRTCHAVLQQHDHGPPSGRDITRRRARGPCRPDQAGWHSSAKLHVPDNITIILFPSRSPELNPVENIWQFMRDNWLSNRVFTSHDDIRPLL